ncbi:MAG: hypothetical protein ACK43M_14470 [Allorhizobium sp.]
MEEEARLVILKELAKEDNKAMSSSRMQTYLLTRFLIDKPREWVEAQYQYLKDMKAVSILPLDSVKLARLEERGEHHLAGLVRIPGVMPTSARPE